MTTDGGAVVARAGNNVSLFRDSPANPDENELAAKAYNSLGALVRKNAQVFGQARLVDYSQCINTGSALTVRVMGLGAVNVGNIYGLLYSTFGVGASCVIPNSTDERAIARAADITVPYSAFLPRPGANKSLLKWVVEDVLTFTVLLKLIIFVLFALGVLYVVFEVSHEAKLNGVRRIVAFITQWPKHWSSPSV